MHAYRMHTYLVQWEIHFETVLCSTVPFHLGDNIEYPQNENGISHV